MTPDNFRNIALSMPGTVEASHKGHPDFRVGGTLFATIGWPDNRWAMVKLTPEQQATFLATSAKTFAPVPGGWGRRGCTNVRLAAANPKTVKNAVETAWENIVAKAGTANTKAGRKGIGNETAETLAASSDVSANACPYAARGSASDLDRAFARVRSVMGATKLPDIEEGTSFGTPSLKVCGKLLTRLKDADTLVVRCPL